MTLPVFYPFDFHAAISIGRQLIATLWRQLLFTVSEYYEMVWRSFVWQHWHILFNWSQLSALAPFVNMSTIAKIELGMARKRVVESNQFHLKPNALLSAFLNRQTFFEPFCEVRIFWGCKSCNCNNHCFHWFFNKSTDFNLWQKKRKYNLSPKSKRFRTLTIWLKCRIRREIFGRWNKLKIRGLIFRSFLPTMNCARSLQYAWKKGMWTIE